MTLGAVHKGRLGAQKWMNFRVWGVAKKWQMMTILPKMLTPFMNSPLQRTSWWFSLFTPWQDFESFRASSHRQLVKFWLYHDGKNNLQGRRKESPFSVTNSDIVQELYSGQKKGWPHSDVQAAILELFKRWESYVALRHFFQSCSDDGPCWSERAINLQR